jgi:hypothetical protein
MPGGYILTSGAESDIRAILDYTLNRWGAGQAEKYVLQFEQCLKDLVSGQRSGKTFSTLSCRRFECLTANTITFSMSGSQTCWQLWPFCMSPWTWSRVSRTASASSADLSEFLPFISRIILQSSPLSSRILFSRHPSPVTRHSSLRDSDLCQRNRVREPQRSVDRSP